LTPKTGAPIAAAPDSRIHPGSPTEPSISPLSGFAALAAAVLYGCILPPVLAFDQLASGSSRVVPAALMLALATYSALRVAWELAIGAQRWFVLIFHSFAYVFLAIAPLVQLDADSFLWLVDASPPVLTAAATISLVGTVMFDAGLLLGRTHDRSAPPSSRDARRVVTEPAPAGARYRTNRALLILTALVVVSLAIFGVRGGFGLVFASRAEMESALCSIGPSGGLAECGLVMALVHVPPVLLLILGFGLRSHANRFLAWSAIAIGAFATFVTANPASNGRFWAGAVAVGLVGVAIRSSLKGRLAFWLLIPALLVLIYPTLDFARQRAWSFDLSIHPETLTDKQDFDAFQQIANGVIFVDTFRIRGGSQAAASVLFFVPRSVWQDKAPATGPMVATALRVPDNLNVSAPLWEEAYVDFGLPGVAAMLAAMGFVVARLETKRQRHADGGDHLLGLTAPFLAGYGVFFLRGPLLPAVGLLAVVALVVILVRFAGIQRAWDGVTVPSTRPPNGAATVVTVTAGGASKGSGV
jgi:hypothetical protein